MKILNGLKTFFAKNTGLKLVSILIAVILWFVVMNTLNPTETKSFMVPISLVNENVLADNGYAVLNTAEIENTRVEIKVRATRPALDELTRQKDNALFANLDFQRVDASKIVNPPQNLTINISPEIKNMYLYSYEVVSFNPSVTNVYFDTVREKDIKLNTHITGTLEEGYAARVSNISDETVTVFGPSSEFDKVGSVIAEINVENKTEKFQTELKPVVYNTNGMAMENFFVEPSIITAEVNIEYGRTIEILKPATSGKISDDLVLKSIDWTPKSIHLTGEKEVIDALKPITLPDIQLDKLVGSDIQTYELTKFINDERVYMKNSTPRVISVTVEVSGKNGKNMTFGADEIKIENLASDLKAQLPSQVIVTVFGEEPALQNVTNQDLQPSVDLKDFKEGAHEIPIKLTLPSGIEIRGESKVYVFITKQSVQEVTEATTQSSGGGEHGSTETVITETTTKASDDVIDSNMDNHNPDENEVETETNENKEE